MTERAEMEAALEAILFVSSDPVPRHRLLEVFDQAEREEAGRALDAVLERFAGDPVRGVQVEEVAGGVRLITRPDLNDWLRRFFEVTGGSRLSMAALETLAIVAYRQPVTAPEVQELRGVNPAGVLKTLLERRLVRIAGRKEVVGKPFLYCTTREFLVQFGLKSLQDLPPLEELEEMLAAELTDGGEPPPEPGLGDGDREETILRRAAEIEEGEDDEVGEVGEVGEKSAGGDAVEAAAPAAAEAAPAAGDEPPAAERRPAGVGAGER